MNHSKVINRIFNERRKKAIALGKAWVRAMIKNYKEPTRKGTRTHLFRGKSLGLSMPKYKASLLMVLYPTLQLKDIARLVGTSEGVMRVWRSEQHAVSFGEAESRAYEAFGTHLANTIISKMDGENAAPKPYLEIQGIETLVELFPFFHPVVISYFTNLVKEKYEAGKRDYALLALVYLSNVMPLASKFFKTGRDRARNPAILDFTRIVIEHHIDCLADPDVQKKLSGDEIKKIRDSLKKMTFDLIDLILLF